MSDCLFCKIIAGEIPSTHVYEDDNVYAFRDIAPQAETHILVIPKLHIADCSGIDHGNSGYAASCFEAIAKIAAEQGLSDYRVISNTGAGAGQTVFHLHFHLLAGDLQPEVNRR